MSEKETISYSDYINALCAILQYSYVDDLPLEMLSTLVALNGGGIDEWLAVMMFNAGRIEGVRQERKRKYRHNVTAFSNQVFVKPH